MGSRVCGILNVSGQVANIHFIRRANRWTDASGWASVSTPTLRRAWKSLPPAWKPMTTGQSRSRQRGFPQLSRTGSALRRDRRDQLGVGNMRNFQSGLLEFCGVSLHDDFTASASYLGEWEIGPYRCCKYCNGSEPARLRPPIFYKRSGVGERTRLSGDPLQEIHLWLDLKFFRFTCRAVDPVVDYQCYGDDPQIAVMREIGRTSKSLRAIECTEG